MTKLSLICKALLKGEVLTMMDGYKRFMITNLSRELSRSVEQKFFVTIAKDRVDFKMDCGLPGWYYRYRLNQSESNSDGIKAMQKYVEDNGSIPEKRAASRPKEGLDISKAINQTQISKNITERLF